MNLTTSASYTDLALPGLQSKGLDSNTIKSESLNAEVPSFSKMLQKAIDNVNGLQENTADMRNRFEMGDENISLGDVMIAANKSSLAFDATVQVRNKMVEAYKEVMSMPV